jgi:hypothetical protein
MSVVWSIHRPVLWGSTTGWCRYPLSLLALLVGVDRIIYDDGVADKLGEGSTSSERKVLLKLSRQASHEVVLLLLISVNLLRHILR